MNWKEIKTANGNGTHLPNAISQLFSENEKSRYDAYWQIDNSAILQSDLYEAAYYVIVPIVEMLEKKSDVNKLYAIRILTEIALGGNGNEVIELKDKLQIKMTIIQACRDKFKTLKNRLQNIMIEEEDEKEEMETLLNEINGW